MNFEQLVREKERDLFIENLIDLRNNINKPNYFYKIKNYCDKYNFNIKEIQQKILIDDVIASFFIKNPFKQNFVENLISNLLGIKNCHNLERIASVLIKTEIFAPKNLLLLQNLLILLLRKHLLHKNIPEGRVARKIISFKML